MKNYGIISQPLTELLKDSFKWTDLAQVAFDQLKATMVVAPILALPYFSKTFIVETDTSFTGLGAVLMQKGHPIAFISKALEKMNLSLSIYEKELMSIVHAVEKGTII